MCDRFVKLDCILNLLLKRLTQNLFEYKFGMC